MGQVKYITNYKYFNITVDLSLVKPRQNFINLVTEDDFLPILLNN